MAINNLLNEHVIEDIKGILNNSSNPSDTTGDVIRSRFNLILNPNSNLCYSYGHKQFLRSFVANSQYNNQDLHDKLFALMYRYSPKVEDDSGILNYPDDKLCNTDRIYDEIDRNEPIIFLKQFISTWGENVLIAGTYSCLYEFNEFNGNWRILGNNLCDIKNKDYCLWKSAQVGDQIIFTNGAGPIYVYDIRNALDRCNMSALRIVSDLNDIYKIKRAQIAAVYNNVVFISNYYEDIKFCNNKIRWSNYGNAENWDEAKSTFPGEQIFDGEVILNMCPFAGYLLIATNKGFWLAAPSGSPDTPVMFSQMYFEADGSRCLFYPNTLFSTGKEVYYLSINGLYSITTDRPEPVYVTNINLGLKRLFNNISKEYCNLPVCGFNPNFNSIYISYYNQSITGQKQNNETVVIIPDSSFVSYLDHGYSSFAVYDMGYKNLSLRDYLLSKFNCVDYEYDLYPKEGRPLVNTKLPSIANFYNSVPYEESGFTFENVFTAPDHLTNTLSKLISSDISIKDLCTTDCKQITLFIGVDTSDNCIKELNDCFSRDIVTLNNLDGVLNGINYNPPTYNVKTYSYSAQLCIGPIRVVDKILRTLINYLIINLSTDLLNNNELYLAAEIYESHYPKDMTDNNCGIVRRFNKIYKIDCQLTQDVVNYEENNIIPVKGIESPLFISGNYYYIKLTISGINNKGEYDANMIGKYFEIPRIVLYYSRKE